MEEIGLCNFFKIQVLCPEGVVGPRVVEEDTVRPGGSDDHGVGGAAVRGHQHASLRSVFSQTVQDDLSELVVPHLSHELRVRPQHLKRQPRVGHGAAGADVHVLHLNQLSWSQDAGERLRLPGGKDRGDVQADVPRYNDLPRHRLTYPLPALPKIRIFFMVSCFTASVI